MLLLRLLFAPAEVGQSENEPAEDRAVASLLDGRMDTYEQIAREARLSDQSKNGDSLQLGHRGLVRLLSMLAGDELDAIPELVRFVENEPSPELAGVAAVLLGIALSDAGFPSQARERLEDFLANRQLDNFDRSAVRMHIAARLADEGEFESAAHNADQTVVLIDSGDVPLLDSIEIAANALRAIATNSASQFRNAVGFDPARAFVPVWKASERARTALIAASAIDDFLHQSFTDTFTPSSTRTFHLRSGDPIEQGLSRSLFRAECSADWETCRQLRKSLGQFRLLKEVQGRADSSAHGLHLLRRAGDEKSVDIACQTLRLRGPLASLQAIAVEVARSPWPLPQARADLALIKHASVTFDGAVASAVLHRLMPDLPELRGWTPGAGALMPDALSAVAGVLAVSEPDEHRWASPQLRELAESEPDPLLHQSLPSALHALDWRALSSDERGRWLRWASDALQQQTDHLFPAIAVIEEMLQNRSPNATQVVVSAFEATKSLLVAAVLLQMNVAIPDETLDSVTNQVITESTASRERWQAGQYSLGLVSLGRLLGRLTSRRLSRVQGNLLELALDARAPISERVYAIDALASVVARLDARSRARLAEGLSAPQLDLPLFGGPFELRGAELRLRGALGSLQRPDAIAELADLAHRRDVEARLEAAASIPALALLIEPATALVLLLGLTQDEDRLVRARAGSALVSLDLADTKFADVRIRRLQELAEDPGEVVPHAIWAALARVGDSTRAGASRSSAAFVKMAREAVASHPAHTVRRRASAYLERSEFRVGIEQTDAALSQSADMEPRL